MKCPKCEAENTEGATVCSSCGCALMSVEAAATSKPIRTCALAIASLVLGLLSFCTFFLTAPLAIIFGIISLVMISKSQGQLKGKGFAIAGIIVGIVMLLFGVILLPLPAATARIAAHKQLCARNLHQLGIAMREYAADNNNRYPTADKWCDLLKPYYKDSRVLTCYSFEEQEQLRRYYALNPLVEPNSPPDTVLLFDSKGQRNCSGGPELLSTDNHGYWYNGCNILFNDGSVQFIKFKNINKLRWTQKQ